MKFVFLTPGPVKDRHIKGALEHYSERLKKYGIVEFKWTGEAKRKVKGEGDIKEVVEAESRMILNAMEKMSRGVKVIFDERGKLFTSEEFAREIERFVSRKGACVVSVIGGAYGFNEDVRKAGDLLVALSRMTFPHELALLLAVEQIYRAMTILKGEKYHH